MVQVSCTQSKKDKRVKLLCNSLNLKGRSYMYTSVRSKLTLNCCNVGSMKSSIVFTASSSETCGSFSGIRKSFPTLPGLHFGQAIMQTDTSKCPSLKEYQVKILLSTLHQRMVIFMVPTTHLVLDNKLLLLQLRGFSMVDCGDIIIQKICSLLLVHSLIT